MHLHVQARFQHGSKFVLKCLRKQSLQRSALGKICNVISGQDSADATRNEDFQYTKMLYLMTKPSFLFQASGLLFTAITRSIKFKVIRKAC